MGKFNVGDRVKLVKVDVRDKLYGLKVGMVATVEELFYGISRVNFDNWNNGFDANKSRWYSFDFQLEKMGEEVVDSSNYGKLKFGDVCRVGFGGDLRGYEVNDLVEIVELRYTGDIGKVLVRPYGYNAHKSEHDRDWFMDYELVFVSRDNKKNFLDEDSISRDELEKRLGKENRAMRLEVAKLAEKIGVISLSKVGGYRLVKKSLSTSEEIAKEMAIVQHQINEHQSRIDHLNKRTSRLIADLEVLKEQQMDLIAKGK